MSVTQKVITFLNKVPLSTTTPPTTYSAVFANKNNPPKIQNGNVNFPSVSDTFVSQNNNGVIEYFYSSNDDNLTPISGSDLQTYASNSVSSNYNFVYLFKTTQFLNTVGTYSPQTKLAGKISILLPVVPAEFWVNIPLILGTLILVILIICLLKWKRNY